MSTVVRVSDTTAENYRREFPSRFHLRRSSSLLFFEKTVVLEPIAEDMASQQKDVLRTASKYAEREYTYHCFVTVFTSMKGIMFEGSTFYSVIPH
ncbi:hypothetical protein ANCCAN_28251 [Ancylostoma caninum]|uniref:Uncharacterized protein n=1 Tax=Ancylostoma caninum TaxID=29170 RepID=A0A368F4V7_ANCCA|nr:hypothetical protein ANCCAN_28251 [Ancylostoma caninum]